MQSQSERRLHMLQLGGPLPKDDAEQPHPYTVYERKDHRALCWLFVAGLDHQNMWAMNCPADLQANDLMIVSELLGAPEWPLRFQHYCQRWWPVTFLAPFATSHAAAPRWNIANQGSGPTTGYGAKPKWRIAPTSLSSIIVIAKLW